MKVTFEIPDREYDLPEFNDEHLAFLWHVAQHNPAEFGDEQAGRAAELISREIVRRWLKTVEPELWRHQGGHYYWNILRQHGCWVEIGEGKREWRPGVVHTEVTEGTKGGGGE